MRTPTAAQFIAACRKEVGTVERPTNRTRYAALARHANGYAWCHTFLAGMAVETGLQLPDGTAGDGVPDDVAATAYTPTGLNAWRKAGMAPSVPAPGDWGYCDFPGDGVNRVSHVFLITAVHKDGTVSTIEGNTSSGTSGSQRNGGGVYERRRPRSIIKGYGRPAYGVEAPPLPAPVIIVKRDSVEDQLLGLYPALFLSRPIRRVDPDPSKDVYAAGNPADIAFGVGIWGAGTQIVGENRYETLRLAVASL